MKVVVFGSGGREHQLARILCRDAEVLVTPGRATIPGSTPVPVEELVADGSVDLVVFGPEDPLTKGKADDLRRLGVPVFGPGRDGARMEGSKIFMKEVVDAAGVRTAPWQAFDSEQVGDAIDFAHRLVRRHGLAVIKTDYLAAGKGVLVTSSLPEITSDIRAKLRLGSILVEEPLEGFEVSVFAVCDGQTAVCLPAAQDFKRVGNGDVGPNTGGMGAWSPLPFLSEGFEDRVRTEIIEPVLAELRRRGIDYRGVLYAGLMVDPDGNISLVEFNIRFGDPDSQVVLERMISSLTELLLAAAQGDLSQVASPTFSDETVVLVVMASEGYPTSPRPGDVIKGVEEWVDPLDTVLLHAGTDLNADGQVVTAGGRVLNIMGKGSSASMARLRAIQAMSKISWSGEHHRSDIALRG